MAILPKQKGGLKYKHVAIQAVQQQPFYPLKGAMMNKSRNIAMLIAMLVITILGATFVSAQETDNGIEIDASVLFVEGTPEATAEAFAGTVDETDPANLTQMEAILLILEEVEPLLPDCTDYFLSGQLIAFLNTENYPVPDLNQWGAKLREDLSNGLRIVTNTCAMLTLEGIEGRIRYNFAAWNIYDGTEQVTLEMRGMPTSFFWMAGGIVNAGNVVMWNPLDPPTTFTFTGPQNFTAGSFEDNLMPDGVDNTLPIIGGPEAIQRMRDLLANGRPLTMSAESTMEATPMSTPAPNATTPAPALNSSDVCEFGGLVQASGMCMRPLPAGDTCVQGSEYFVYDASGGFCISQPISG